VETRPIAPEIWKNLPPEVQAYILFLENALRQSLERITQLEQRVKELEARAESPFRQFLSASLARPASGSQKPKGKKRTQTGRSKRTPGKLSRIAAAREGQ
jgi:hypothetical protein